MAKKNEGKRFEEDFKNSIPEEWFSYRLRDSSGSWSNTDVSRFTPTNICDFFIFTGRDLFGVECKSFKGKSIPYANIKDNQLNGLTKISEYYNAEGLFIFNFRDLAETYVVNAEKITKQKELGLRKSLSLAEIRELGHQMPQTLKRIRYKYDLIILVFLFSN